MFFSTQISLLVLGLVLGTAISCRFDPVGHQNLDFERYKGQWFLIENGPIGVNETGPINCVYEAYNSTASPLVFNMVWYGETNTGGVVHDMGLVTLSDPWVKSSIDIFIDGALFKSKVLATDYVTWAIEYSCNDELGWERFMLRGRTNTLPQAVWQTLHHVINSYGVNVEDFAVVDHSSCSY